MIKNKDIIMIYTSQSATSTYQECPRKRYFQYHIFGTGITSVYTQMPLATGGHVHAGVASLCTTYLQKGKIENEDLNLAIAEATGDYQKELDGHPYFNIKDEQQSKQAQEQIALVEVLIRLWYLREWPKIEKYYHILAIEQEIEHSIYLNGPTELSVEPQIIYQSRPDLILLHKESGDVVNYSLKTIKGLWNNLEKQYKVQNQTFTEPYFTSLWLRQQKETISSFLESYESLPRSSFLNKKLDAVHSILKRISDLPHYPSAIRFCYLIKGERKEHNKGQKDYYTDNPFLYAYRKFIPSGVQYAWSYFTSNPQNKSGYGRLGKGWEEFTTFAKENYENVGGVQGWINALNENIVENDIGDGRGSVFERYVVSMPDVYVNPRMVESRIKQLFKLEIEIASKLENIKIAEKVCKERLDKYSEGNNTWSEEDSKREMLEVINNNFSMNTGSCYFPSSCQFLTICSNGNTDFRQNIADDPLSKEHNLYQVRVPHHEPEQQYHINKQQNTT